MHSVEHSFALRAAGSGARRAALAAAVARTGGSNAAALTQDAPDSVGLDEDAIAVPPALGRILPRGVQRGEVISVRESGGAGIGYTSLALIASALSQGLWSAAIGAIGLGGAALAGMLSSMSAPDGALQHLLIVREPGDAWPEVSVVLADGVDLLVLQPPSRVPAALARRVDARIRQNGPERSRHRPAVIVLGQWPTASTILSVERIDWTGLAEGTGHLRAGSAKLTATDRARRERAATVWLPTLDGGIDAVRSSAAPLTAPNRSGGPFDRVA